MGKRNPTSTDTPAGLGFAITAYLLWGFLPSYMKALDHIGPLEIVAHRILWSVPIAAVLLVLLKRTGDLFDALRSPRMLAMACVTAALISLNWAIYVWAVVSERALEAALGYYVNPLFSIALAFVLLGERPSALQWVAIALAASAVALIAWESGSLPLAAVGLMTTWGFYALAKKQLPIGPNQGFLLEVLLLLPLALGYLIWLGAAGRFGGTLADTWLLIGCGAVTAIPLILYANGAKRLRLSTISILQYIAPTMIFLQAVFVFGEPFSGARLIAFPMIWAALVVYSIPMIQAMRR
ncbi:MAG: EamA family transporter RarD [Pseudomonadota bacterium]